MTKDEILKAIAALSSEDRKAVQKEIAETPFSPMEMCQMMMDKMKGGEDPMAFYQEMKEKCCN